MREQDFEDAVNYIYSLAALGWKPGLERMALLCERLGNPQDDIRCVHIGGTNGKGSTTVMVAGILQSAGYRVGSYYSPYVYDIRERIQLNGEMIGKSDFVRLLDIIRPHAAAISETEHGHPTEFEVKTALAFLYFAEKKVDFAVLEVGLGGRLDATNIVNPLLSAITNVTFDHTDRLGETIEEIAGEKAGIIKQDGRLVTAAEGKALDVIRQTCEERNCTMLRVEPVSDMKLGMRGDFQRSNAAVAVGIIEVLRSKGIQVPESAVRSGLESAYLPGRLEVLRENPTLLIDGAHNLDGARSLARALKELFACDKLFLIIGMVSGHSVEDVVGVLAPLADGFYATAADNPRSAPASLIAEVARRFSPEVREIVPVAEAVRRALESAGPNDLVCVTGSFYVISEVPRPG